MLLIPCPWCGPRAESEFNWGGEGGIVRPLDSERLTDQQWCDYLFMRRNTLGLHHEQWRHTAGCGRWFNARRDTASHRIVATWKVGESDPALVGSSHYAEAGHE